MDRYTLLTMLYQKNIETAEHAERVEIFCRRIGRKLRLSARELEELSLFAIVHDIGKVCISPDILKKPGPLTPAEWKAIKRHPEIGSKIALSLPELAPVAEFILFHHERWDGTGYPRGLKEKDIPLYCRILAVSDAFDAMTSDRVYRKALDKKEAALELKKNAGIQFDPEIVPVFIDSIYDDVFFHKGGRL